MTTRVPATRRGILLALLRRLSRAGQRAPLRRAGPRGRGVGQRRAGRGAVGAAAALRAVSAVRHRRSVVVVARGLDSRVAVAGAPGTGRAAWRRRSYRHGQRGPALYAWATEVLFEVRKQRSEAKQPLNVPITQVAVTAEAGAVALMPHVEADFKGRASRAGVRRVGWRITVVCRGRDMKPSLDQAAVRDVVRRALAEDIGAGDVTTNATDIGDCSGRAVFLAKADFQYFAGFGMWPLSRFVKLMPRRPTST